MSEPIHDEELKEKRKRLENPHLPMLYTENLMEIFDFDETTLNMNRRNFVTQTQREMILEYLKGEVDSMWLMLTIMMGTSIVLAIIFATQGLPTIPLILGVVAVVLPLLWYGYSRRMGLMKDTERLRALRIDGIPTTRLGIRGTEDAYMNIGNQNIPITFSQARALHEFDLPPIRVYYAEHSKRLLSAEVLQQEKLKNEDLEAEMLYEAQRDYDEREG